MAASGCFIPPTDRIQHTRRAAGQACAGAIIGVALLFALWFLGSALLSFGPFSKQLLLSGHLKQKCRALKSRGVLIFLRILAHLGQSDPSPLSD
jgi:hypothetical protein